MLLSVLVCVYSRRTDSQKSVCSRRRPTVPYYIGVRRNTHTHTHSHRYICICVIYNFNTVVGRCVITRNRFVCVRLRVIFFFRAPVTLHLTRRPGACVRHLRALAIAHIHTYTHTRAARTFVRKPFVHTHDDAHARSQRLATSAVRFVTSRGHRLGVRDLVPFFFRSSAVARFQRSSPDRHTDVRSRYRECARPPQRQRPRPRPRQQQQ